MKPAAALSTIHALTLTVVHKLLAILGLVLAVQPSALAGPDWVIRKDKDGIKIYMAKLPDESFRAVKVARALQRDQGIVAGGIIALSPLLEGSLQFGASRFALGAALILLSVAMVSNFAQRLPGRQLLGLYRRA